MICFDSYVWQDYVQGCVPQQFTSERKRVLKLSPMQPERRFELFRPMAEDFPVLNHYPALMSDTSSGGGTSSSGSDADKPSSDGSGDDSKGGSPETSSSSGRDSRSGSGGDGSGTASSNGHDVLLSTPASCAVDPRVIAKNIKTRKTSGDLAAGLHPDDLVIVEILIEWPYPLVFTLEPCSYLDAVDTLRGMLADFSPIVGSARFWDLFGTLVLSMSLQSVLNVGIAA